MVVKVVNIDVSKKLNQLPRSLQPCQIGCQKVAACQRSCQKVTDLSKSSCQKVADLSCRLPKHYRLVRVVNSEFSEKFARFVN